VDTKDVIVGLAGGVGGARLARGLARIAGTQLAMVVNTGDDFDHFALRICPDLDTVMYTLAGRANPETGWGVAGESWNFMTQMAELGGADWFRLGDRDLATHVLRTALLRDGETLTAVTATLAARLGIEVAILPMSDSAVRTRVQTAAGLLDFQDYFVRQHCEVPISGLRFDGAREAQASGAVIRALAAARVVVICPSNPFVSIDPILAVGDVRRRLQEHPAPVIAVSPIIGGKAVKGPAAKMMAELGHAVSSLTVAEKYRDLLDGIVIDEEDAHLAPAIEALGMSARVTRTLMPTPAESLRLAEEVLEFAETIRPWRR
jgi:LPPG:FO 2-phospho-L-lactate transferase